MNWQTIGTTALVSVLMASTGLAQCNRGGSSANRSASNAGFGSEFTSLSSPFNTTLAGLQLQSQRAQMQQRQQAMLAQQQMFRQALAQRQRQNSTQLARQRRTSDTALANSSSPTNVRQARLRQKNAEKAFALALKAEANGRTSSAEKYYRRVIRIAGENAELIERAETAIAGLAPVSDKGTLTALASLEL